MSFAQNFIYIATHIIPFKASVTQQQRSYSDVVKSKTNETFVKSVLGSSASLNEEISAPSKVS